MPPRPLLVLLLCVTLAANIVGAADEAAKKPDVWAPLRFLVGTWTGDARSEQGVGQSRREYWFVLNGRFLEAINQVAYVPTEEKPQGENREDRGLFSCDRAQKKAILRQFHVEGFVNTYALESISADGKTLTFTTTAIENIAPGWRAREVYPIVSEHEFIETFSLAAPDQEFAVYSETRLKRKSGP